MLNAVLALVLHFLAASLAVQSPTVEVEFDRNRDFTEYHTYAWSSSQLPADSTADHVRITKAIADKLEEAGLSPKTSGPDVRIRYRLESENKKLHADGTQRRSPWDPTDVETNVRLGDHKEMLLIVEMFDAKTDALVWRAQCSHLKPSPDLAAKSIRETVERLFEKYPTKLK